MIVAQIIGYSITTLFSVVGITGFVLLVKDEWKGRSSMEFAVVIISTGCLLAAFGMAVLTGWVGHL